MPANSFYVDTGSARVRGCHNNGRNALLNSAPVKLKTAEIALLWVIFLLLDKQNNNLRSIGRNSKLLSLT